jgi:hypothetical protein
MVEELYGPPPCRVQAPEAGGRCMARDEAHPLNGRRLPSGRAWRPVAAGFLLGVVFPALVACSPPDRPPRLPGGLPPTVVPALENPKVWPLSAGPGLAYFQILAADGPWAIHLLRVDLNRCDLGFRVLKAPAQGGTLGGRSRMTELSAAEGVEILAAVNGDFFTPEGLPLGTEVVEGRLYHWATRPTFSWRPGGGPWMGLPDPQGDSVLVPGRDLLSGGAHGAMEAIGGFPLLLQGGQRVGDLEVAERPAFAAARHPRTALGLDSRQNLLWVAVVDGRQPGYSEGMTLPELAGLLEALGADEALNLDGGGSSVMVLRGVAVSRPSDATGERPVVNGLGIRRDPSLCRTAGLNAPGR